MIFVLDMTEDIGHSQIEDLNQIPISVSSIFFKYVNIVQHILRQALIIMDFMGRTHDK